MHFWFEQVSQCTVACMTAVPLVTLFSIVIDKNLDSLLHCLSVVLHQVIFVYTSS